MPDSSHDLQLFQGLGEGEFVMSIFQIEVRNFWLLCDFSGLDIRFSLGDNAFQVSSAVSLENKPVSGWRTVWEIEAIVNTSNCFSKDSHERDEILRFRRTAQILRRLSAFYVSTLWPLSLLLLAFLQSHFPICDFVSFALVLHQPVFLLSCIIFPS